MNVGTLIGDLKNKPILIIGTSGLICSAFIDQLMGDNERENSSIKIYAVSRNKDYTQKGFQWYWNNPLFTFMQHDTIKPLSLDVLLGCITHGASNAFPKRYATDSIGTMKANLWGVVDTLDLAKEKQARLLYISSDEVYGEGDGTDFTETYSGYVDCLNLRACYPSGKQVSETLCIVCKEQYGVDIVIARPCHIYGSDIGRDDRAFVQFLRKARVGEDIILKSEGQQIRLYCHVMDCASALFYTSLRGKDGEAHNVANRESTLSIKKLAEMIANMAGVEIVHDIPSEQEVKGYSKVQRAVLDSSKLESLGWKPLIFLEDGLNRVLNSMMCHK